MDRRAWVLLVVGVAGCEPRVTRLPPPRDPEAVAFVPTSEVRRVAVGWNDICVVMADGSVRCKNDYRPAGVRRLGSFVSIAGAARVVEVAAGHHHACARTEDGAVLCWGRNDAGEVSGDEELVRAARAVPLPERAIEIRVGDAQSCARLASNAVHCWGAIAGATHAPPTPLDWFASSAGIALSTDAICSFDAAGLLRCSFGGGTPLEPLGDAPVAGLALGRFRGCALLRDGAVRCFQLARPKDAPITDKVPPWGEPVEGLAEVTQLAAGIAHFCARKKDNTVWCWGGNQYGQLGNNTREGSVTPVAVRGINDAADVAAGGDRSCCKRADGRLFCWGADLLADAMFRALTGLSTDPGPPGPNDSLTPEELRIPANVDPSNRAGSTP